MSEPAPTPLSGVACLPDLSGKGCAMSEPAHAPLHPAWRASRIRSVEALRHE